MGQMKVISGGFLATIQDNGRHQCQQLGLAEAGAMDKHALFWANRLLANDPHAAGLEILLGNCSFSFDQPTMIALTGADTGATLNGLPVANWSTLAINPGDTLNLGIAGDGLRAYLAIAGGFETSKFFASSATVVREKTGGNNGEKLQPGDLLPYDESASPEQLHPWDRLQVPGRFIPDYTAELTLNFFPVYHYDEFEKASVERLLESSYTITQDTDRMGCRLSGSPLVRDGENILSIGVPCGAIQVPTAGEPIILLNDRQCTGGYPILGVVAARDIYQLAQRKPGDTVRFALAEAAPYQQELQAFNQFFQDRLIV